MSSKALRAALLTLSVLICALMLILLAVTSVLSSATDGEAEDVAQAQAQDPYLIRSYNGHIAVFMNKDDKSPGVETTIETETLRSVDKEKLQNGIEVNTYEDVLKLLEDFGS